MAALDGWDGALLAEPVGCGKTWIALAVIAARTGGATVIGPAALSAQWRLAATRAAVSISYHSLERLSRGRLPPGARLVVIDEAHRLRHPETHRVRTLAPWLVGREVLLLTATPMVNRRRDLLNLLALLVPDDALALDGVSSLRDLAGARRPPDALRRLVIRTARPRHGSSREETILPVSSIERARCARIVSQVHQLVLSGDPGVRALLRMVLLDAGASSDAAWHAALRRYRDLLLHSREAGGASRSALRHFVGDALEQLVLWPMMGAIDRTACPPPEDLAGVLAALDVPPSDAAWIDPLARQIRDGVATICFCRHRATADALRRRLGAGTAWVTGDGAGIGNHRIAREALLAVFGPNRRQWPHPIPPPTVLVATEVLAEGHRPAGGEPGGARRPAMACNATGAAHRSGRPAGTGGVARGGAASPSSEPDRARACAVTPDSPEANGQSRLARAPGTASRTARPADAGAVARGDCRLTEAPARGGGGPR